MEEIRFHFMVAHYGLQLSAIGLWMGIVLTYIGWRLTPPEEVTWRAVGLAAMTVLGAALVVCLVRLCVIRL